MTFSNNCKMGLVYLTILNSSNGVRPEGRTWNRVIKNPAWRTIQGNNGEVGPIFRRRLCSVLNLNVRTMPSTECTTDSITPLLAWSSFGECLNGICFSASSCPAVSVTRNHS